MANTRIRLGMIGGGQGAFIGGVHRMAARLDDRFVLVAGALSSTPDKSRRSGWALGLAPERAYGTYTDMIAGEAGRPDGAEAVAIVTPNNIHAPAAIACLGAGLDVICDKPLCTSIAEAEAIADAVRKSGRVFVVTYNYTGTPMVRQARQLVREGVLGALRLVQVEYAQGWLSQPLEQTGQKQAAWRVDPRQSGGGAIGDIGTHAVNLAEFVSGQRLDALAADLQSFVTGRQVDDNVNVLLRFDGGARGMLWASQVAVGHENGLKIRVYGDKAGLIWEQEHPNHLTVMIHGEQPRIVTRGGHGLGADATRITRVPSGHPEGYLEAFATIYSEAAELIHARRQGIVPPADVLAPNITDGFIGVAFMDAVQRSSANEGAWTKLATII